MSWVDQVFKWLGYAKYNATPPVLADGDVRELQSDASGNLKVAVVSGTISAGEPAEVAFAISNDLVDSWVVKASTGLIYEVSGFNGSTEDRYLVVFPGSSAPANGTSTASRVVIPVPGKSAFNWTPVRPITYAGGIVWVCSTTRDTVTRSADFYAWAHYL